MTSMKRPRESVVLQEGDAILYITQLYHTPRKTAASYDLGSATQPLLKHPALTSALPISYVSSAFFPVLIGKQQEQPV